MADDFWGENYDAESEYYYDDSGGGDDSSWFTTPEEGVYDDWGGDTGWLDDTSFDNWDYGTDTYDIDYGTETVYSWDQPMNFIEDMTFTDTFFTEPIQTDTVFEQGTDYLETDQYGFLTGPDSGSYWDNVDAFEVFGIDTPDFELSDELWTPNEILAKQMDILNTDEKKSMLESIGSFFGNNPKLLEMLMNAGLKGIAAGLGGSSGTSRTYSSGGYPSGGGGGGGAFSGEDISGGNTPGKTVGVLRRT